MTKTNTMTKIIGDDKDKDNDKDKLAFHQLGQTDQIIGDDKYKDNDKYHW